MTSFDKAASTPHFMPGALRLAPMLYAATLFLSALLLFAVQPMFTKMVLPRLGGAPTVWSVAMVFFQAALLAGYAYAHLVVRRLPLGLGALVHLGVLAAAAATLPIAVAQGFGAPPTSGIALWLLGLFALSIGLPFAVLSASAPLLQGWFAASGHPHAGNPYVLYAASNLGSFAALIAYPVVIEPLLPLKAQAQLWSGGFAVLAVAIALASLFVAQRPPLVETEATTGSVAARDRLAWLALAAIPAGLVIAVTSYITTDVAAAPFLWVVPLALYLLTFVAVFRDRPWIGQQMVARLAPIAVAPLSIGLLGGSKLFWLAMIGLNLVAFVLLALLCHGELYRRRPAPARLTEFYLWVSLGGVLGGIFAALLAPYVFNRVYEYPILVCRSRPGPPRNVYWRLAPFPGGKRPRPCRGGRAGCSAGHIRRAPAGVGGIAVPGRPRRACRWCCCCSATARHASSRWRCWPSSSPASGNPASNASRPRAASSACTRSSTRRDGHYRLLYHGTTLHGAQRLDADGKPADAVPEPLTYYYFGGPISRGDRRGARRAWRVCARRRRRARHRQPGLPRAAARTGPSSRSMRTSFGLRAIPACSASFRIARRTCRSSSAMRG